MWPLTKRSSKVDLLLEERDFLRAQVAQLQNYILMTGGGAAIPSFPSSPPSPSASTDGGPSMPFEAGAYRSEAQRMYTTEEEEDIHFALEEGLIDQAEADRRLREAMEVANDIELM